MRPRWRRVLWAGGTAALAAVLGWAYYRHVWLRPGPALGYEWHGVRYELLGPLGLGAILLAPWFVGVLSGSLADLPWQQRLLALCARVGFVALLALSLARPARTAEADKICAVYLVDVSDSVSDEALVDAGAVVRGAYARKRAQDLVRVVSFARRPRLVEPEPASPGAPLVARHAPPAGAATNLQAALQLAYGLFPPGYLRRAVLVSDGQQTDGDVLAEAGRAAEHGVKLFAVPYARPAPGEVAVRALEVPASVKVGEPYAIRAEIFATRRGKARARLYQGEALNGLDGVRQLDLAPGTNAVTFKSVARIPGTLTYSLAVDQIGEDRFAENNRFATTVEVPGRPAVLYVDGAPQRAGPLSRALGAQQLDVDVRGPAGFPASLEELERFDFVVLSDVPAEAFSLDAQALVERYVRDLGGGFLFAGGEHGYGLGGWQQAPLARILPVRMDAERRKEMPSVAMVLVLDRSGSMTGLPVEMAKQAAKATLDVLDPDDMVEVIAYDAMPTRYVKMQPARNRARIRGLLARIQAGGGTEIFPALDAAYGDLTVTAARKKHVILLTDGKSPSSGIRDLVTAMIAEQITVTTVGLGPEVDEALLRMIADVGGGRYHAVPDPNSLPRIFSKETEMVARAAAVEEWFPVAQVGYAAFLRAIDVRAAPYLHGYVSTKMKPPPAVELLQSDTEEPILARWRVGTGWVLCWTSDVKARWAVEWIAWSQWERFWGQLVHEHRREKHRRELDMAAEVVSGELRASVDAFTLDERFENDLVSKLTIKGPEPGGETKVVALRQSAPGRYEAAVPLDAFGSFLLRAEHLRRQPDGSLKPVAVSSGHVSHPYPPEYASFETDRLTLERAAAATGGRLLGEEPGAAFDPQGEKITYHEELWPRVVMAAIALFLLDLLLRRVRLFDRRFRRRQSLRAA
ncbi:MAG: VWA domain-containing protein [Deltaproteobacteria bacterium]|nr:VWA domain-containing protein [Deltaproteobacteria bacterium]